ncbi:hypothetical protein QBC34DRAFT_409089 [Podospora aff. communis PSN243]|uniref:Secreted protein n=1 Tax=Podospora aff. communis PSN243 TaxID=3040156 RepID=A0AAV9GHF9_9PEZI|nr:hypothetical protein QBC34DRAFT_409089 [Podospora aff. communis PSN243]
MCNVVPHLSGVRQLTAGAVSKVADFTCLPSILLAFFQLLLVHAFDVFDAGVQSNANLQYWNNRKENSPSIVNVDQEVTRLQHLHFAVCLGHSFIHGKCCRRVAF